MYTIILANTSHKLHPQQYPSRLLNSPVYPQVDQWWKVWAYLRTWDQAQTQSSTQPCQQGYSLGHLYQLGNLCSPWWVITWAQLETNCSFSPQGYGLRPAWSHLELYHLHALAGWCGRGRVGYPRNGIGICQASNGVVWYYSRLWLQCRTWWLGCPFLLSSNETPYSLVPCRLLTAFLTWWFLALLVSPSIFR